VALPDERIPDEGDSRCDCFLCGRTVWIGNPGTGSYSSNARFAPDLPIHLCCLEGRDMASVARLYGAAINDADRVIRYEHERARLASLREQQLAQEMKSALVA